MRQIWNPRSFALALGLLLLSALAPAALTPAALGHAFAPALLELQEAGGGVVQVRFKQPAMRPSGEPLRPVFPEACEPLDSAQVDGEGTGIVARWRIRCAGGLVGQTVAVTGIAASRADVLLRFVPVNASSIRQVLTADAPSFVIPAAESSWRVAGSYGRLGVEHIAGGFDHLLFVLGLVLLVDGRRRLLGTVTAFTAGHSVTLALASLGLVFLPSRPVEALIALSIVVLAVEISQDRKNTPMRRRPWLVAGGFGLLHGLGFAGALTEVGLPEGEIPAALLAFNVGIELGQLAFIALLLGTAAGLRWLVARWSENGALSSPAVVSQACVYLVGTLGVFWLLQRVVG